MTMRALKTSSSNVLTNVFFFNILSIKPNKEAVIDLSTLVFDYHCYLNFGKPKGCYNYCKGDYAGMLSDSSMSEWADITSYSETSTCVEETWQRIKTKFLQLRN